VWKDLHEKLHQHQVQNTISNIFHDLLNTAHNAPTTIVLHHLPHDIQALHDQQEHLGWKQLYYGWLLPQWIHVLQTHHPQINGIMYYSKCIKLIWQAVLKVWTLRNAHFHPWSHEQEDRSLLEAAVCHIFGKTPSLVWWLTTSSQNRSSVVLLIRSVNG